MALDVGTVERPSVGNFAGFYRKGFTETNQIWGIQTYIYIYRYVDSKRVTYGSGIGGPF